MYISTLLARLFALIVVLNLVSTAVAENWPQWRGGKLDGISQAKEIPQEWSNEKNVVWRVALPGPAGATPVVWGDRIFLTALDGEDLLLLAFDSTGKELWRRRVGTGNKSARGDEGNMASPSPSTDGTYVWSFMGSGDLACFDFDGKPIWSKNLQKEYGNFDIQFGMSSTPVLHDGKLFIQSIHSGGAIVLALDGKTGNEIWKHRRESDAKDECEHSYASPVLYQDEERAFLLTHGADYIIAHDLKDGTEIWRAGGLNPKGKYNNTFRLVASPVAVPGLIVVPSAKNGPVLGLRPDGKGDITADKKFYHWSMPSNTPDVPSPLVYDGLVYLCRENGNLIVLDAKTGERYYETRTYSDRYRASPTAVDGKIILTSRDGTMTVLKPGKKFERLAENKMNESISSSPAFSDSTMYLRTFDALYAIRKP
ncbi:MAG: PQQ-binding-like beta-propeller repeat protein [Planctomycetota bacterium]|nr:PQQ-binding-like beta-propeller repeat protein [Planctomycetota bacterium]